MRRVGLLEAVAALLACTIGIAVLVVVGLLCLAGGALTLVVRGCRAMSR